MNYKPMFKIGQLIVLAENCPYVCSTANKRDLFEIKPEMVGMFLGYAETKLKFPLAVVLFGDVTVSMAADRLSSYHG